MNWFVSDTSYRNITRRRFLLEGKLRYSLKLMASRGQARTVLCFPTSPHPRATIRKLCNWTGCRMTTNPREPADVVIHWDTSAIRTPIEQIPSLQGMPVVNAKCIDVSKENVDRTFAEVFGYDMRVDPRTHSGSCVRKSNENGTHDGVILTCPIAEQAKGYVYQRLLNNRTEDGFTEDIRIPVFGSLIPIVFRCKKEAADRFAVPSRIVRCCETSDVLSMEEIGLVLRFCQNIGLDYGELDVLRDRDDGRIYVVDANPTPWGPPAELAWRDQSYAMRTMAHAFEDAFPAKSLTNVATG